MTNKNITLTETKKDDLNALFQFQLDKEANYLAAFTSKDANDKTAYIEKHTKFLIDPTIKMRTIKVNQKKLDDTGEIQISTSDPESRQLITRNNITEVAYNVLLLFYPYLASLKTFSNVLSDKLFCSPHHSFSLQISPNLLYLHQN